MSTHQTAIRKEQIQSRGSKQYPLHNHGMKYIYYFYCEPKTIFCLRFESGFSNRLLHVLLYTYEHQPSIMTHTKDANAFHLYAVMLIFQH